MEENKRSMALLFDLIAVGLTYGALVGLCVWIGGFEGAGAPFHAIKAFKADWPDWWLYSFSGCAGVGALLLGFNPYRGAGEYGDAAFATEREIKAMGLRAKTGVILGKLRGRYLRFSDPLSVLIVAPPDCGKTAGIIVPTLLSCGHSCVVVDVKPELYDLTAQRRAAFSKVRRFAPGMEGGDGWNPLDSSELPSDWIGKSVMVERIAAVLYPQGKDEGNQNYWQNEARSVFVMFALYLVHKHGGTSIPAVRQFAFSKADTQVFIAELADEPGVPDRVREEGYNLSGMADKQFSGVWGTFKERLNVFADPHVAANMSRCDFSLHDLRKECTTVYLQVGTADLDRFRVCIALFLEVATTTFMQKEKAAGDWPVTFFPDEFPRLGYMPAMLNMPALSRGFGVNSVFVVQSVSQMRDIYGPEKTETLMNTCAFQVFFTQNEIGIAETVSKAIGPRTRKKLSFSTSESRLTRNTSSSNEGVPLITQQDVMNLGTGEILILRQKFFKRPIKAKDARWFSDGAMKPLVPRTEWR